LALEPFAAGAVLEHETGEGVSERVEDARVAAFAGARDSPFGFAGVLAGRGVGVFHRGVEAAFDDRGGVKVAADLVGEHERVAAVDALQLEPLAEDPGRVGSEVDEPAFAALRRDDADARRRWT
jgi:hypothetical protein